MDVRKEGYPTLVHQKYTYKNGKTYGPYLYENKRIDGRVVTRYLGQKEKPNITTTNAIYILLISLIAIGAIVLMYHFFSPTANVAFEVDFVYKPGEPLEGLMRFRIKEGELVPKDSIIRINYGSQSKNFALSELISDPTISGEFYAEGKSLSGSGEGYGVEGSRIVYPTIDFDLLISSKEKSEEESDSDEGSEIVVEEATEGSEIVIEEATDAGIATDEETAGEETAEEGAVEESSETSSESTSETSSESSSESSDSGSSDSGDSSSSDSGESSDAGITGAAILESESIISGQVSEDEEFTYILEKGQKARIAPGSVKVDGEEISESSISLKVFGDEAEVTTDYFINERGFGEDFLGDFGLTLYVDVKELDLIAEPGLITVELVSGDDVIAVHEEDITVFGKAENKTEEETKEKNKTKEEKEGGLSFAGEIETIIIPKDGSAVVDLSEYFSGAESYDFDAANITALFDGDLMTLNAEPGFSGSRSGKVTGYFDDENVESNLFNILVSSGAVRMTTSRERIKVGEKVRWVKNISFDTAENTTVEIPAIAENVNIKQNVEGEIVSVEPSLLTGEVIIEMDLEKQPRIIQWIKKLIRMITGRITGRAVTDLNDTGVEVVLENSDNYVIEYETSAPTAVESEISGGKKIVISGPDEVEYTDVIAFTELNNSVSVLDSGQIKIYWHNYDAAPEEVKRVSEVEEKDVVEDIIIDENGEVSDASEENLNLISGNVIQNSYEENKKKEAFDVASKVQHISTDYNNYDDYNYINISVYNDSAEKAPVAQRLQHRTDTSGPDGLPGSTPGWGDSAFNSGAAITGNAVSEIPTENYARQLIPFDAYDLDDDGNVDYIEWVVPHLSNQTFEIIIEISKAEHLDANRTFVEDVYDSVKARDGNWTTIPDGDYLRVTFEENLTSEKDITIYARAGCNETILINGVEVPCEIFEKKTRIDEIRGELG